MSSKTRDPKKLVPTRKIAANKEILSSASSIFNKMDDSLSNKKNVMIHTIPKDAPSKFHEFIYKEKKSHEFNLTDIVHLVKKYGVFIDLTKCAKALQEIFTVDNVCSGYEMALHFNHTALINLCEEKIISDASDILKSDGFFALNSSTLKHILKLNSLQCSDFDVLFACTRWAECECERQNINAKQMTNLRKQLKTVLDEIHFNAMTVDEFASHIDCYPGFFTNQEIKLFVRNITSKRTAKSDCKQKPQEIYTWSQEKMIRCERFAMNTANIIRIFDKKQQYNIQSVDVTEIRCNKMVLLGGIVLTDIFESICERKYDSYMEEWQYDESIRKVQQEFNLFDVIVYEKNLYSKSKQKLVVSSSVYVDENCGKCLYFTEPVALKPNSKYEISLEQKFNRDGGYIVRTELSTHVKLEGGLEIKFQRNFGLISTLLINIL